MKHLRHYRTSFTCLALILSALTISCTSAGRTDLAKLTFKETAASLINYNDRYAGGINTLDAPMAFGLQASRSGSFTFNGVAVDSINITFLLRSDKIRKDTSRYQGGASVEQERIKDHESLNAALRKYQADSVIYGYRIRFRNDQVQEKILKELVRLYGQGTKNPNTDHGYYWNLKSRHRFVFFAPDYHQLLVVDNERLSKTCFWDPVTGGIDFGGCDMERYQANMLK